MVLKSGGGGGGVRLVCDADLCCPGKSPGPAPLSLWPSARGILEIRARPSLSEKEEVEKVRRILEPEAQCDENKTKPVSHLCCYRPACWTGPSGGTSGLNLKVRRRGLVGLCGATMVELCCVGCWDSVAAALLTARNVTG